MNANNGSVGHITVNGILNSETQIFKPLGLNRNSITSGTGDGGVWVYGFRV